MSCDVGCMLVREDSADKQCAQELLDAAVKNIELDVNQARQICQDADSATVATAHTHTPHRACDILQHVCIWMETYGEWLLMARQRVTAPPSLRRQRPSALHQHWKLPCMA